MQHYPWKFPYDEGFLAFVPYSPPINEKIFFVKWGEPDITWRPKQFTTQIPEEQPTGIPDSDVYASMAAILMSHKQMKGYTAKNPQLYPIELIIEEAFRATCRKYNI